MMKKIICIILIVFLPLKLVAIETTQFKYPVGFGTVSPMIEVGLSHDDNIFSQDNGSGVRSSWIGIFAPTVLWSVNSGLNQYRVKYGFQAGNFFDSHNDDYIDHRFETDAHLDFNLRHRLDLEFDFLKLHERRGTGLSDNGVNNTFINEPDKYRDIFLKGSYQFGAKTATGNVELSLSHLDRKYTNHEDLNFFYDRNVDSISAAFIYRFRPDSSFIIEAKHNRIRYDDSPLQHEILDNDENILLLGIQWEGSALTTGSAKIGYEKKNFKSAEYAAHNFIPWELGLIWSPRSYSKVNLTTYSQSEETSGTGTFIQSTNVSLSWQHDWSERFGHLVAVNFSNEDYIDSEQSREDKIQLYDIGVQYLLRRGIILGADYTFKDRNSNIINHDYVNNIFMFSAKVGL